MTCDRISACDFGWRIEVTATLQACLQRVLDRHGLQCGAVVGAGGIIAARAGDFDRFRSAGLVSTLLGPYGSPEATFDHIQNKDCLKPVVWSQGDEFAFVDRAGDFAIVVFGRNCGDVLARAKVSRLVAQTIAAEFTHQDH